MKKSITILFLFASTFSFSQELTGNQLLEKSIAFHDPNNAWKTFSGTFYVTMKTPKKADIESEITIDLPNQFFNLKATTNGVTTAYTVIKKNAKVELNGAIPNDEQKKKYNLSFKRANLFKNYYTYLYGLPMKLKDEGTIIHPKVEKRIFKNKEYLVLKVTYDEKVGTDTWYFYFNPKNYALEVYQFFKDTKDSGEYILLSDLEIVNGIKMPKNRAWYFNKNDEYLGTDFLTSTKK